MGYTKDPCSECCAPRFQAIIIDQTVGVVESYASHDLLAKNHPYIQLYLAENVRKGLEAVSNGQTYAFVGKDMEQRAAQLAELVENEAALIDRLKYEATVKDKFFSIIAHALKSPFDSLLGMTEMMSRLADRFSKDQLVEYATNVNETGGAFGSKAPPGAGSRLHFMLPTEPRIERMSVHHEMSADRV